MMLERVHRKGPKSATSRSIIVRFQDWKERESVWKKRPKFQDTSILPQPDSTSEYQPTMSTDVSDMTPRKIHISQDYPPVIVARRCRLIPILKKAKELYCLAPIG